MFHEQNWPRYEVLSEPAASGAFKAAIQGLGRLVARYVYVGGAKKKGGHESSGAGGGDGYANR
jgi:hypothetical protein